MPIIIRIKHSVGWLIVSFWHCSYFCYAGWCHGIWHILGFYGRWLWVSGLLWHLFLCFLAYCVGYVIVQCQRKYHSLGFLWSLVLGFCYVCCCTFRYIVLVTWLYAVTGNITVWGYCGWWFGIFVVSVAGLFYRYLSNAVHSMNRI